MKFGGILGFDHGIILAPMGADISGPELAAAVANAGGIGLLASPTVSIYILTFLSSFHFHPFLFHFIT